MNINPPAANTVVLPFVKPRPTDPINPPARKLHGVSWMGNVWRNHLVSFSGEFVGTFLFLFFAFSGTTVANLTFNPSTMATRLDRIIAATASRQEPTELLQLGADLLRNASAGPQASILLYIALSFGFSLAVNAWVFFRITGGMFNPAVSFVF